MYTITSDRQFEIIQSAGKLLMEKGVKGLTTKNLAQAMNFSESALYRHFKNKEDIVVLLLNYMLQNMEERMANIMVSKSSASQNLSIVFENQFNFFKENPHSIVAILSEGLFNETERINSAILKIVKFKTNILYELIQKAKSDKQFHNGFQTSALAHVLMGTFRLMLLKWKISKFEIDLVSQGNEMMQTTIKLMSI